MTSSIQRLNANARDTIQQLLHCKLARFSSNIAHVSALIVDENGPCGGIDNLCRVNMLIPRLERVTTVR